MASTALLHGSRLGAPRAVCAARPRHSTRLRVTAWGKSPALDLLASSQRVSVLDHADAELLDYCVSRPTPEESAACMSVYKYYHDRRQAAQSGCVHELEADGAEGSSCHALDTLEKMVYEVAYSGDAEQLYHVLKTQANMAKRAAAGLPMASDLSRADLLQSARAKALELFQQIDADGNGVIDREEFLGAMKLLQHALGDSEMQLVFTCMDSHGFITPEQFVDIVQAEQLCDPACDAEVLRHVPHAKPSWWSDAPHCVMDV